jgi:hypothetical protein
MLDKFNFIYYLIRSWRFHSIVKTTKAQIMQAYTMTLAISSGLVTWKLLPQAFIKINIRAVISAIIRDTARTAFLFISPSSVVI